MCWVSGNARVYGDARVSGNAWVYGNALVHGDAQVSGSAWVCGNAHVYGNARVYGNAEVSGAAHVYGDADVYGDARLKAGRWTVPPLVIQGTRHLVRVVAPWIVVIGCEEHEVGWWRMHASEMAKRHGYTAVQIVEYNVLLDAAEQWMQAVLDVGIGG